MKLPNCFFTLNEPRNLSCSKPEDECDAPQEKKERDALKTQRNSQTPRLLLRSRSFEIGSIIRIGNIEVI